MRLALDDPAAWDPFEATVACKIVELFTRQAHRGVLLWRDCTSVLPQAEVASLNKGSLAVAQRVACGWRLGLRACGRASALLLNAA